MSERDKKFDVRSEIMKTINDTDDKIHRSFLMLMLGVLDRFDELLEDEIKLRETVLNGHAEYHDEHHRWIAERIKNGGYCDWAKLKREEEDVAKQDKKSLLMKFLESIVSHIGTAVAVGLMAYFVMK